MTFGSASVVEASDRSAPRAIDVVVKLLDTPGIRLPPNKRLALLLLAYRMFGDSGESWPSLSRLAREMGVSLTTVKRTIRTLKALRMIEVDSGGMRPRTKKGRAVRSNVYRLGPAAVRFIRRTERDSQAEGPSLRRLATSAVNERDEAVNRVTSDPVEGGTGDL